MKILLVSSRNIYNSTGEIRLIKNRANVLLNDFGITTDFICYRNKEVLNNPQEIIDRDSEFVLFPYSMTNPFSIFKNKKSVVNEVLSVVKKYDAVILSGELVLNLVNKIKARTDVPVIYDIHGVCDELSEFKADSLLTNMKRKMIYHIFQYLEKKYINKFDAAFAVTEELKKHVSKKYDAENVKYFIVPCAKRKYELNVSEIKENRTAYRKKYNISDDEIVFIYSGGYSPWQCVDETIELFHKFNNINGKSKLLILSGDKDNIDTKGYRNIIKTSVPFNEVDAALCAGDYAFMLRGDFVTNHVAFPNKYCEYLASGMRVISSPYLYTISESIKENNVGLVLDNNDDIDKMCRYIEDTMNINVDFGIRQKMLDNMSFDETLKPFAEYLGVKL